MKNAKATIYSLVLIGGGLLVGFLGAKLFVPYQGKGENAAISGALPFLESSPLTSRKLTDGDLAKMQVPRRIVNFAKTEFYLVSQNGKGVALVELAPFLNSGWHMVEYRRLSASELSQLSVP